MGQGFGVELGHPQLQLGDDGGVAAETARGLVGRDGHLQAALYIVELLRVAMAASGAPEVVALVFQGGGRGGGVLGVAVIPGAQLVDPRCRLLPGGRTVPRDRRRSG